MRNAAGAIGTARANGKGRLVLWATLIVGVLALARYLNAQALLRDALRWIQGLGPMGWVIFVLLYSERRSSGRFTVWGSSRLWR